MNRDILALACCLWLIAPGCSGKSDAPPENMGRIPPADGQPAPADPGAKLTAQQSAVLMRDFQQAIALLENAKIGESCAAWDKLAHEFPNEPSFAQNRAVAWMLAIKDAEENHGDVPVAQRNAEGAMAAYQRLSDGSALADLLQSRVADKEHDIERRIKALQSATTHDPKDASLWLELADAAEMTRGEDRADVAYAAICQAHELAPGNLLVLHHLLLAALQRKDPAIAAMLKQAAETIGPVSQLIAEQMNQDPAKREDPVSVFNDAAAAAEKMDWNNPVLTGIHGLRGTLNVLKPSDAVQSDMLAIQQHDLELLADRPSDAWQARLTWPIRSAASGAPPRFLAQAGPADSIPVPGGTDFSIMDFTMDGQDDVLALSPGRLQLFEKSGAGWQATIETQVPSGYTKMAVFDFDADTAEFPGSKSAGAPVEVAENRYTADLDAVLYGPAGLLAVRNRWDADSQRRTWEPLEAFPELMVSDVQSVAVLDVDIDGDLDLLISDSAGPHLLINLGNSTFRRSDPMLMDITPAAAFQSAIVVDFDRDVDLDVIVASRDQQLGLFENLGHGLLRWKLLELPSKPQIVEVAELDGNVSWDVITAGADDLSVMRTRTVLRGKTETIGTDTVNAGSGTIGLLTMDYDNDAAVDVVTWSPSAVRLWRNSGTGALEPAETPGLAVEGGRWLKLAAVDLDRDGDIDLAALTGDEIRFWNNDTTPQGHFLNVSVVSANQTEGGVNKKRINHYGYGSLLELKAAERYHAEVVRAPQTHFGLNGTETPEVIRVTWPNGVPQNVIHPAADTSIMELQSLLTSCPYLYSWDGERFVFVTDLLWGAPLGLPDAAGGLVPCRDWEYLKIAARQLRPHRDRYELRVTEELWETAYFDQLELVAVDHPAAVDIFTNEKVGPPEMARPMIHTSRNLRSPAAAADFDGHDILEAIRSVDDVFARTWKTLYMQGYAPTHGVELDLGPLPAEGPLKLFLTGWLMPTDAGLAVGIQQDPRLAGPAPPAIEIPDGAGGWKTALPFMGFPGGKTKTMVVDISDFMDRDDPRLRITTGQELYWDRIAFTAGEAPEPVIERPLTLAAADLHFRGYSAALEPPENAPETYNYDSVQTQPRWSPMKGRLTRYGDVLKLLQQSDDRLVVLGAGDEVSLAFQMPPDPVPAGWVRDFVLHNVGWEKDAQLNTVWGRTIGPLPSHGMSGYPFGDDQSDDDHPGDQRTRETSDAVFRRLIDRGPDISRLYW